MKRTLNPDSDPIPFGVAVRLAQRIIRMGKRENATVGVAGGLAMLLYGHARNTKDVDVVASKPIASAGRFFWRDISFGGSAYLFAVGKKHYVMDVIVRDDHARGLYESAVNNLWVLQGLPVVGPEHLVLMKADAGRYKDHSDIQFLLSHRITSKSKVVRLARKIGGVYYAAGVIRLLDDITDRTARERSMYVDRRGHK